LGSDLALGRGVREDTEVLMLIKIPSLLFHNQLIHYFQELHSYHLPEIIAQPILTGEKNYLNWLNGETSGE